MSGRVRALSLLVAIALGAACAPQPDVQVGVRDYSTDVVYGAKKKPPPLDPIPAAEPTPLFPPPIIDLAPVFPAAPAPVLVPGRDAPPPPPPSPACPEARISQIPPPAARDVSGPPAAGAYPYRVSGTRQVGTTKTPYATTEWRTLRAATASGLAASSAWDVTVVRGADEYTTTYQVQRPTGSPDLDGIYVRRVVRRTAGGAVEDFNPSGLGLRIFALPADLAVSWTSVATDPLHQTSVRLTATETQRRRVNACGTVVEGWDVVASIDMLQGGGVRQVHSDATYVVAPQLGGLVVADTTHTTEAASKLDDTVDATINALTPAPTKP